MYRRSRVRAAQLLFCINISLVGQDSRLSPGRHGFDSRMRHLANDSLTKHPPNWQIVVSGPEQHASMAEWLRRQIRNLVGSARVSSNLTAVALYMLRTTYTYALKAAKWYSILRLVVRKCSIVLLYFYWRYERMRCNLRGSLAEWLRR